MPKLPRITVITPSFNQGQFLEESIRSVLDQEYPDLEYLLIDGGSRDQSLEVIQKYAQRFDYWVSEADNGQSDAINKGFQRATGDLVAWLNADDFYLPGAFKKIAQVYQSYSDASFYFGDGYRVDERGQIKSHFFPESGVRFYLPALIYGLNYILQPSTFINRIALEKVGYLDPHLHWGLDTDLWIRLAKEAEPLPVQEVFAASREYGKTKTSTGSFRRIEELRGLAEKYSSLPMTPGALCYFLDTLRNSIAASPEFYPPEYLKKFDNFWYETAHLMGQFEAGPDGFPLPAQAFEQKPSSRWASSFYRRILRRLGLSK
jgi:GT2 family glycosyltransferase